MPKEAYLTMKQIQDFEYQEYVKMKAQLGLPMYVLIVVIVTGVILSVFSGAINDVRVVQLAATPSDQVFQKVVLYSLMPLIWIFYILLSVFAVKSAAEQA